MNKHKILKLIVLSFCFCLFFSSTAQAEVTAIGSLYLELNLPDQVIYLSSDTSSNDPLWKQAGITDVSSEKDELSKVGGKAILYDPDTDTLVRLLSKASSESKELFNLNQCSKEERQDFYARLMKSDDESATITVDEYPQSEIPFFRMYLHIDLNGSHQEIIYGTIVNGTMIYFDYYTEGQNDTIDETFLQSLVAGTHFTKQYTKEEYRDIQKQGIINLALLLLAVVAVIIVLVYISKLRKNKKALNTKKQKDALYQYYATKKEKETLGIKPKLLFENHTTYSEEVIQQFCFYTFYQKRLYTWIITAIIIIFSVGTIYTISGVTLQLLIIVALIIGIFVFQYFKYEKQCTYLWKPYATSKSKVADFKFYEDHFTMTGIQSYTEYPYLQITSINEHKGFIYLYISTDRGFYLSKNGFTTSPDEFLTFLKGYLKHVYDSETTTDKE